VYAYLAPLLAALGGALLTALVLGINRLSRQLSRRRATGGEATPSSSVPDSARDAPDPALPTLAHSTLDIALLLGFTGIFFFAYVGGSPAAGMAAVPVGAAAVALLAGWLVAGRVR
jgi:hypothetical protein